ncbi:MAG: toll/interleukin-1 receptor domain-containing protein [Chloroflexi bacterium]|nr:toll/interleukin-1 receptor domain-containing protein [Chloroflexota bacterium]
MPKRVFLSYSHDSNAHKNWVLELATFLRGNGIDVILDRWDVEYGDDLAAFMESAITTSDRVIVICTDEYVRKANAGIGGVGYEKTICTAEMLRDYMNRRRFIPVVRNVAGEQKLPTFFGAALYSDLSNGQDNDKSRTDLVRAIYEVPRTKPPLGLCPFVPEQSPPQFDQSASTTSPVLGKRAVVEFSDRFSQAFPGLRGMQWFEDPKVIAERLKILLRQPLVYDEGEIAWWWRGHRNLQIGRFEQIEGRHFLMDGQEINLSRLAAINLRDVYHRKWLYVETSADNPTGLYSVIERDVIRRVQESGYDYEEYGLVDGTLPVTRAEYDDGAAIIEGNPVSILGRVVLRSRYTTPYNFVIAPHESPINNTQFDHQLETLLNQILQESDVFDILCNSIAQLPTHSQLYR